MLTKEFLDCRLSGSRLLPHFLPPNAPDFLEIAGQLLLCCRQGLHHPRCDLHETLDQLCSAYADRKRSVDALRETLENAAVFSSARDIDYPAKRRTLFLASATAIKEGFLQNEGEYRKKLEKYAAPLLSQNSNFIYADLPDNDILVKVPEMLPQVLIEETNMAMVQGFLLYAKEMKIIVQEPSVPKIRRMLTRLRFHRLLASIESTAPIAPPPPSSGSALPPAIQMTIEGPCAVLSQARSYGMQMALFFPAVCAMTQWRIRAKIMWKNRERILELETGEPLSFHGATGSYEPPEIQLFRNAFSQKAPSGWKLQEECSFIRGPKGLLITPDFAFLAPNGKTVYIELFHRWHSTQLEQRLDFLENPPKNFEMPPLVLAVDRAVATRPEMEERLQQSPYFQKFGFLYRDFPTIDKTISALCKVSCSVMPP